MAAVLRDSFLEASFLSGDPIKDGDSVAYISWFGAVLIDGSRRSAPADVLGNSFSYKNNKTYSFYRRRLITSRLSA